MTGRVAATSGRAIWIEETGAGRPVLALHGVGGGAWFFHGLAERLDLRYAVTAVDLPGTGRSGPPEEAVSLDAWIADLGDLVAARATAPVVVIGHSLGTMLALQAWQAWPERIAGLVFVGGLPEVRPVVRDRLAARLVAIGRDGIEGWGPKASPGIFSPAAFRRRPEVVGLFERLFEAQVPASYIRSVEILLGASLTDVVPTVDVPCLSVSGADDQYAPPDEVTAFIARLPAPARQVVLPDVGHVPFFEDPEAFAAAVGAFLAELPS